MKLGSAILPLTLALSFSGTTYGDPSSTLEQAIPAGAKAVAVKEYKANGQSYKFVKYLDRESGEVQELLLDASGKQTSASAVPKKVAPMLSEELMARFAKDSKSAQGARAGEAPLYKVNIALKSAQIAEERSAPRSGTVDIDAGGQVSVRENGNLLDDSELLSTQQAEAARLQQAAEVRRIQQQRIGEQLIKRNDLQVNKALATQLEEGRSLLTLNLTERQIRTLAANSADLIDGVEPYIAPQDGITGAMIDTRVDPYALNYSNRTGSGIGIYMTESGCANNGHITNYTRLGGSRTDHAENVTGILRAVSPDSYVYCRGGAVLPSSSDLNGSGGNPRVHIATRSNGQPGSNSYLTLDRSWDNLVYNNRVLTFLLAGNNGNSDDEIWSPGKGLNMITVGNYNDASDTMNSSSSARDPQTKNQKPELSAPGTSITAGGHTMTGTSMATPHAAAFAADLLGAYSWLRLKPAYAKAFMLAGAIKPISGGANAVGVGGLNFYEAYYNGTNTWWEGNNASVDYFDDNDGTPNSGYIERPVYLSSSYSDVRIVFSWLNRGDYTYSHRTDAHPIGMDMDISVYSPSGSYVAGSFSWDNPYEMVNFDPTVSGTYVVKIRRYANRDTSSKFHAGLSISW